MMYWDRQNALWRAGALPWMRLLIITVIFFIFAMFWGVDRHHCHRPVLLLAITIVNDVQLRTGSSGPALAGHAVIARSVLAVAELTPLSRRWHGAAA